MKIAVIGGTSLEELFDTCTTKKIRTKYGTATIKTGNIVGKEVCFIKRHGENHKTPPHKTNHKANIQALSDLGIERIVSVGAVGSLKKRMKPGDFLIPNDFIDWTKRTTTFYDDETVHVDMTKPYCEELRYVLYRQTEKENSRGATHFNGTYVCTEGPRFETAAEIKMLARFGDVIGMTSVPEAILAREREICYASLCFITNYGAGLSEPVTIKDVLAISARKNEEIRRILIRVIKNIPDKRTCRCGSALHNAKVF
jgi:5'-methylthioadenosine phosphorylase